MYTDPGGIALMIAAIVGFGLSPLYFFRDKIKLAWQKITKKGEKNG